jgi:hypothetical protein
MHIIRARARFFSAVTPYIGECGAGNLLHAYYASLSNTSFSHKFRFICLNTDELRKKGLVERVRLRGRCLIGEYVRVRERILYANTKRKLRSIIQSIFPNDSIPLCGGRVSVF